MNSFKLNCACSFTSVTGAKSVVSLHTTWQGVWRWRCCIIMSARWKQAIIWSCDYILPKHAVTPRSYRVVGCLQASVSPLIVGMLWSINCRSLLDHYLERKPSRGTGRMTQSHTLNYAARFLSFPIFLFSFPVQRGHAVTFFTPQNLNHVISNYKWQLKSVFWHMQQNNPPTSISTEFSDRYQLIGWCCFPWSSSVIGCKNPVQSAYIRYVRYSSFLW